MPRFATASQGLIEQREIGCVAHLTIPLIARPFRAQVENDSAHRLANVISITEYRAELALHREKSRFAMPSNVGSFGQCC
ncbi:MAG: hypothetical protein ETSY2_06520 [Candidatus Entotheonella gemina]|uniref:Uncharacterized protein n=1 Tax=Candidatus Entotheonella gemina TaxID=1429439 RepID=W4ME94_9BACT|nr:MAG: hypothetical protein ETSY2_06520 [Candidatus Entotheonella gemina]